MRHQELLLRVFILLQIWGVISVYARKILQICNDGRRPLRRRGEEIAFDKGVDGNRNEQEDDDGADEYADDFQPLEPYRIVPSDGLEHRPETVVEMQPEGYEPDYVEHYHPPVAECGDKERVRVFGLTSGELFQLHLRPEMGQVEREQSEDENAEDEHILGGPGIILRLAGDLVTLDAAPLGVVLDGEPYAVDDVDQESQRQDGDHYVDERCGHEVASELEETVSLGEQFVVSGHLAERAGEGIDDGEEIDGAVKEQEEDEESAGYALDELLSY